MAAPLLEVRNLREEFPTRRGDSRIACWLYEGENRGE
jgi:hypothetical protein